MKSILDCIYWDNYAIWPDSTEIEWTPKMMDDKFKMIVKDLWMYTTLIEEAINRKYDEWKSEEESESYKEQEAEKPKKNLLKIV